MFIKKILADLFPFYCLHCRRVVEVRGLCSRCFDLVRPLSLSGRCHICFKATFKSSVCQFCLIDMPIYHSVALFSNQGPSYSLIQSLKMGSLYALELIVFFLEQHLENLDWKPDMILSFHHLFLSKEKSAYYVAQQLGKRLNKPLSKIWCSFLFFDNTFVTKRLYHKKMLFLCENKTEFIENKVQNIAKESDGYAYLLSLKTQL
ncbi:hypothetical protein [Candidatus Clavichlamydia salmonicola]|uniref:hypothetical protein n=1 Tax=Candidatus Clavichlamydia salmonicola TaxID=469812 RepID=UPI0018917FC9|nr:hypothetical protein [Candidatus Clavichlamydia salmonicola]